MKRQVRLAAASAFLGLATLVDGHAVHGQSEPSYLSWTAAEAQKIGRSFRVDGRVGSAWDFRVTNTDRAYNYKLRATWLTGDAIRATARLAQLSDRLTDGQTEALVREAERMDETVILIEIDPREGSGVIPLDWLALLGPSSLQAGDSGGVKGRNMPQLRSARALSGAFRRDYSYELFWMAFPLRAESGQPLFPEGVDEAELVVRIYNKEGRVKWRVPDSLRTAEASSPVWGKGTWSASP